MDQADADVPWSRIAAILAINRRCAPGSELAIEERWYPTTALDDWLHIADGKVNDSRLYRALDQLLPHKTALERHLTTRYGELFAAELVALLGYALWVTLKHQLRRRGTALSPTRALAPLATLPSADIVLPTTDGREIRLRRVAQPTSAQQPLLDQLEITIPAHLEWNAECSGDFKASRADSLDFLHVLPFP